jgi:AraC-like DNA-binding protein/mannose-6-phosphate isomerase-like protein (cupin superfamily)
MATRPPPHSRAIEPEPRAEHTDDRSLATIAAALRRPRAQTCRATGPATHTHAALAFYTAGEAVLDQGGRWRLAPGDVMLVPAGSAHRVEATEAMEYWGVAFCAPCLVADGCAELLAPFDRVRHGASPVVHIPEPRRPFLVSLLRELEDLTRVSPRAVDPAVPRSVLTLVLHEIARALPPVAETDTAREGGVVADALRYIERHCLRPLTLREVARAVRRAPAYVTTALSRATGRSAVAWIIEGRMAEARRRLLQSDEHVDVIAERVGYADATHFIRLFRRMHGATPSAWRALQLTR